jgi:polar amino acid transport system substrate-binding protein
MAADPRIADLVQAKKLRAALFLPQYAQDAGSSEIRGVGTGLITIELARTLAAKLGVELQIAGYSSPSKVVACLKAGACDVALMGIEPSRSAEVDFSPAVVQFDYTYLVPTGSPLRSAADVDRPGIRVAVVSKHASTLTLSRLVKNVELVGADIPDSAFEILRAGKADAFASAREALLDYAAKLPGSRVLDDSYGVNNVGMAMQKGHAGRLAYISEFIEEAKASGLVKGAIERAHLPALRVAPRADAH